MNANKRKYQIQIFIRVHWRLFAVLLVRLYPIEIDFDDSKWWCSPRSVSNHVNNRIFLATEWFAAQRPDFSGQLKPCDRGD